VRLHETRELQTHWQRVAKLVLAKEEVPVNRALELALNDGEPWPKWTYSTCATAWLTGARLKR
jgi:hypothetical protein